MMWWGGDWSWGAWLLMTVTMFGFWALVIWAVASFVRGGRDDRPRGAEDVLAERFARGEIDEEEFQRRRDLLRAGR